MTNYTYNAICSVARDASKRYMMSHSESYGLVVDSGRLCGDKIIYTVASKDGEGLPRTILFEGTLLETFDFLWAC